MFGLKRLRRDIESVHVRINTLESMSERSEARLKDRLDRIEYFLMDYGYRPAGVYNVATADTKPVTHRELDRRLKEIESMARSSAISPEHEDIQAIVRRGPERINDVAVMVARERHDDNSLTIKSKASQQALADIAALLNRRIVNCVDGKLEMNSG
jgi:hypothetical protein